MVKKNHSVEFITLWNDNRVNRGPLVSTVVFRVTVSVLFVMFVITRLFKASVGLMFGVALLLVILMILSRQLKKQSILIERKFFRIFVHVIYALSIWERKNRLMPDVCFQETCI